mmetsp:Transcript_38972/g.125213  ORF Transcript_38972/g.125213 Transcript_38972/m.125213 type:complete len:107 (+) Transcript_38972:5349-5669(+)
MCRASSAKVSRVVAGRLQQQKSVLQLAQRPWWRQLLAEWQQHKDHRQQVQQQVQQQQHQQQQQQQRQCRATKKPLKTNQMLASCNSWTYQQTCYGSISGDRHIRKQ